MTKHGEILLKRDLKIASKLLEKANNKLKSINRKNYPGINAFDLHQFTTFVALIDTLDIAIEDMENPEIEYE